MQDLNAYDLEGAKKIIAGTARNLGVTIEQWPRFFFVKSLTIYQTILEGKVVGDDKFKF